MFYLIILLGIERRSLTLSFPVQSSGEMSLGYIPACIPAKLFQSCPTLCNPMDCCQAPLSMGFSSQEH